MSERFPGYDVLDKRNTPSWNEKSRAVIDARLALPHQPRFFTADEWVLLIAVCDRIVPQPAHRRRIPVEVLVDRKLEDNDGDGYRHASLPPMQDAWRQGLHALNEEARLHFAAPFDRLESSQQDAVLRMLESGATRSNAWHGLPAKQFFRSRVLHDVATSYYAFPEAWNEIGFGGPASPRGYVRMDFNRRDPWEAVERKHG